MICVEVKVTFVKIKITLKTVAVIQWAGLPPGFRRFESRSDMEFFATMQTFNSTKNMPIVPRTLQS